MLIYYLYFVIKSGCDERFWKNQEDLIYQLPEQKKNKILAKVLQLPVIRWQKKADLSKDKVFERNRRDAGSGDSLNGQEYDGYDDDNENYDDDYDEDEDEDNKKETVTENNINAQLPHVSSSTGVRLNTETESEHPHRHHHGEETIDLKVNDLKLLYLLTFIYRHHVQLLLWTFLKTFFGNCHITYKEIYK